MNPTAITLLFGLTGVAAIGYTVVKLAAQARTGDWDLVVKTVIAVFACIAAALLLWCTDFADFVAFSVGGHEFVLTSLNWQTIVWIGLSIGFTVAAGTDVLRAIDNTRSSATPTLVNPSPPEG